MLPALQLIVGLVLFWETASVVLGTYVVISFGLVFFLIDTSKSIFKNLLEIASVSILLMIIGFFLPGSEKVLVMRYVGITLLSILLIYFIKKQYYVLDTEKY